MGETLETPSNLGVNITVEEWRRTGLVKKVSVAATVGLLPSQVCLLECSKTKC